MRINKYVAAATGLSRRAADKAIEGGRVAVNGQTPKPGYNVQPHDNVTLDDGVITPPDDTVTIMLNKPAGYVSSRRGQGSKTVYDLLPKNLHHLKPIGRLDKDSSGLLLLTNDGELANRLTHPRYMKEKIYEVHLNRPLAATDLARLKAEVKLEDGMSKLGVQQLEASKQKLAVSPSKLVPNSCLLVTMTEGRNRQIRRTFAALGYTVTALHRLQFGPYTLGNLLSGHSKSI